MKNSAMYRSFAAHRIMQNTNKNHRWLQFQKWEYYRKEKPDLTIVLRFFIRLGTHARSMWSRVTSMKPAIGASSVRRRSNQNSWSSFSVFESWRIEPSASEGARAERRLLAFGSCEVETNGSIVWNRSWKVRGMEGKRAIKCQNEKFPWAPGFPLGQHPWQHIYDGLFRLNGSKCPIVNESVHSTLVTKPASHAARSNDAHRFASDHM